VEARNAAENMIYQTEKLLKEQAAKIAGDKKSRVESAIRDLKEAVKSEDTERVKSNMEALNQAMQAVSADLYAQAKSSRTGPEGGAGGAGGGHASGGKAGEAGGQKDEGEVIDADFEMVDDDKKGK